MKKTIRINVDAKACRENQTRAARGHSSRIPCVSVRYPGGDASVVHSCENLGPCRVVARTEGRTFSVVIETESEVIECTP
jgi:hypothetical protein